MLIFKKLTVFWEKIFLFLKQTLRKYDLLAFQNLRDFLKILKKDKKYLKDNLGIFKILIFQQNKQFQIIFKIFNTKLKYYIQFPLTGDYLK